MFLTVADVSKQFVNPVCWISKYIENVFLKKGFQIDTFYICLSCNIMICVLLLQ